MCLINGKKPLGQNRQSEGREVGMRSEAIGSQVVKVLADCYKNYIVNSDIIEEIGQF